MEEEGKERREWRREEGMEEEDKERRNGGKERGWK